MLFSNKSKAFTVTLAPQPKLSTPDLRKDLEEHNIYNPEPQHELALDFVAIRAITALRTGLDVSEESIPVLAFEN